jgi:hypothetical protein
MDIETALTVFTALAGSKILEPTTEAIGKQLKENLSKIAQKCRAKIERHRISGDLTPNNRLLKEISNEGAFCDDELMTEYFGGVLASSLAAVSRDDRAFSFASLIGRLTTYQIRSHFIFYNTVKKLFDGRLDLNILVSKQRNKWETFIPNESYYSAMEFGAAENPLVIIPSVMSGLARENLIEKDFEVIGGEKTAFCGGNGVVFCPTDLGVDLFYHAYGKSSLPVTEFLKKEHTFLFETAIKLPAYFTSVEKTLNHYKEIDRRLKPEF